MHMQHVFVTNLLYTSLIILIIYIYTLHVSFRRDTKTIGPFYLVSMPGEIKETHGNRKSLSWAHKGGYWRHIRPQSIIMIIIVVGMLSDVHIYKG